MLRRKTRRVALKHHWLVYCVILGSVIAYALLIYRITTKALRQREHLKYPLLKEPENLSCSEICSVTVKNKTSGMFYPLLRKQVDCLHMLHLLHRNPTPQGSNTKDTNKNRASKNIYKEDYINELIMKETDDNDQMTDSLIKRTFSAYEGVFYNKRGVVLGSQRPLIEAMLLSQHAKHITTLDYHDNNVFIHPRISKYNPYDLSEAFLKGQIQHFDFAVSYDFVENSGSNKKGDLRETHGDLQTVAQVWCMLKPRGLFFLMVPLSHNDSSYMVADSHRVYAADRLQHLTANFNVLNHFKGKNWDRNTHLGMWVLQKIDI